MEIYDFMDPQKDYYNPKKLTTTSTQEQYDRQRVSDEWQPEGFDRFSYQKALLDTMSVLGGPADQYGANPDRYDVADPKEATNPVKQPRGKKK